jgi:hypothetical protein
MSLPAIDDYFYAVTSGELKKFEIGVCNDDAIKELIAIYKLDHFPIGLYNKLKVKRLLESELHLLIL